MTGARITVTPPAVYAKEWKDLLRAVPYVGPEQGLDVSGGDVVLVVGAHPDDETFGVGGTIASLARSGVRVHALSMTAGESALDHLGRTVAGLGDRRTREYSEACTALGVTSSLIVGLPDGRLSAHAAELTSLIADVSDRVGADRVLAVWWGDPHPDHRAVGQASIEACVLTGRPVTGYPIWAQHWCDPGQVVGAGLIRPVRNDVSAESARQRAVDCYRSQTEPLQPDLEAVLPRAVVEWRPEILLAA
jgi:LmbE family N-acetylglucosaminyl deacetylase